MSEHRVYLCGWRQSSEGFCLWTTTTPRVTAEAETYAMAEGRLREAIIAQGGANHAVLEFDPPLPRSTLESRYAIPDLVLIEGDARFETDAPRAIAFESDAERESRRAWLDSFFEKPVCRKCLAPNAPRSERALQLACVPGRSDGAFGAIGSDDRSFIQIVSEEFLALLSAPERDRLVLRPVRRRGRSRRFHELIGPAGPEFVAVAGLPASGWRCSACGHSTWGYWMEGWLTRDFVAASELPCPLPGIFTVGTPPEVHLCATAERWRELVGRKGARGFVSRPVGVVPDRELVRRPELPSLEERGSAER